MKYQIQIDTPIGPVCLQEENGQLCSISFGKLRGVSKKSPLLNLWQLEVEKFFAGKRHKAIPLSSHFGTEFQLKVWKGIASIPLGQVWSYKTLAEKIGSPKAYRAVGSACGKNPFCLLIPCHRVVGVSSIGGFSGPPKAKVLLLRQEGHINY